MKKTGIFVAVLLAALLAAGLIIVNICIRESGRTGADRDRPLQIVASFYPIYVEAENVIGDTDGVKLTNMTEDLQGCLHEYQMTTGDMKLLSNADLLLVNGAGLENFITDTARQLPDLKIVNTGKHVNVIDDNAHYWLSLSNCKKQVSAIAKGLADADPQHAADYKKNAASYNRRIDALIDSTADLKKQLDGQPVIVFHEAFEYLAQEYGLKVCADLDLDGERQISANEVSDIMSEIEDNGVKVIFAEKQYGKNMGKMIEKETDADVVYLDTLMNGSGSPDSYLNGMEKNIRKIRHAFAVEQE